MVGWVGWLVGWLVGCCCLHTCLRGFSGRWRGRCCFLVTAARVVSVSVHLGGGFLWESVLLWFLLQTPHRSQAAPRAETFDSPRFVYCVFTALRAGYCVVYCVFFRVLSVPCTMFYVVHCVLFSVVFLCIPACCLLQLHTQSCVVCPALSCT